MQNERLKLLYNESELNLIQNSHILIIGLGGVGGSTFESLVRFGIKKFTIIDNDTIDSTNLNRQIISSLNNIGELKIDAAKKRALDINPDCTIEINNMFLTKDNINAIFNASYSFVIDCCDTITTKLEIIRICDEKGIKLISCLGTGNRFDPTQLKITTLNKTFGDPVAKILRKLVKENSLNNEVKVIWSEELPLKTKNRTPGSNPIVPNVAGYFCAYEVIKTLKNSDC